MKYTAIAPSNIAFIKYWGKKDEELRLPENGSISMNLSNLLTTTTVDFSDIYQKDTLIIDNKETNDPRVIKHLDRIRLLGKSNLRAKIVSINNFPSGTGLSSSASGFAALSLAGVKALGVDLSEKELSILARQGSGSSCRSIPDGITEWLDGNVSEDSYAISLYKPDYWDLVDVVAVVSSEKKEVATSDGQKTAQTSPFYQVRLEKIKKKINLCKKYLAEKNFQKLGELIEQEALELHAIMLTSNPSLIYWTTGTLLIMKQVAKWREEGIGVYFTINTGQDIHLVCQKKDEEKVQNKLNELDFVKKIIINYSCEGARITDKHLF